MSANSHPNFADDPRLTAYVLDELSPAERTEIERELARNPAARAAVEEIRQTTDQLLAELSTEPELYLRADQRQALEAVLEQPRPATQSVQKHRAWRAAVTATLASVAAVVVLITVLPPNDATTRTDSLQEASHSTAPLEGDAVVWSDENETNRSAVEREGKVAAPADDGVFGDEIIVHFDQSQNDGLQALDEKAPPMTFYVPVAENDPHVARDEVRQLKIVESAPAEVAQQTSRLNEQLAGAVTENAARLEEESMVRRLKAAAPPSPTEASSSNSGVSRTTNLGRSGVPSQNLPKLNQQTVVLAPAIDSQRPPLDRVDSNGKQIHFGGTPTVAGMSGEGVVQTRPAGPSRAESLSIAKDVHTESVELGVTGNGVVLLYENYGLEQHMAGGAGGALALGMRPLGESQYWYFKRHHHLPKPDASNEDYEPIVENEFLSPWTHPLSTFSIDVDTGSYSNMRRFLNHGQWPPANAVRIEEMINYFDYDDPVPEAGRPFAVQVEAAACPWQSDHCLVRIGLKGQEIPREERPPSNLVFLIDVSGSMRDANKLPLVKSALQMLAREMTEDDRIAIVTYAGTAGLLLDSTSGADQQTILSAIGNLQAGGSTNGEAGIKLAYEMAVRHFIDRGTNRIILCTDGDFNVGVSGDDQLVRMIRHKAASGVFLSIFGFGMGNLKDAKLEKLADNGNGHYGYVDTLQEARKVFVEELVGTLYTIAKDVKIQVEFNPARVGAYRLIGYENRVMAAREFNDDTKDAGEIGAGHSVTALYEIVPVDKMPPGASVDPLKYQQPRTAVDEAELAERRRVLKDKKELLTVKLRYKQPDGDRSTRLEFPLVDDPKSADEASQDLRWAAAVASFGMILRDSRFRGDANLDQVIELAESAKGADHCGHRQEFIGLVRTARSLRASHAGTDPDITIVPLSDAEAEKKAAIGGKYCNLLKRIKVPGDVKQYGQFKDFGHWDGTEYAGHTNLPKGYWVYVAPHWYIWGDVAQPSARGR